jgi:enolase
MPNDLPGLLHLNMQIPQPGMGMMNGGFNPQQLQQMQQQMMMGQGMEGMMGMQQQQQQQPQILQQQQMQQGQRREWGFLDKIPLV